MGDVSAYDLLREEMESDETHLRVNAVHRLKIVGTLLGPEGIKQTLLPYIDSKLKHNTAQFLLSAFKALHSAPTFIIFYSNRLPTHHPPRSHQEGRG